MGQSERAFGARECASGSCEYRVSSLSALPQRCGHHAGVPLAGSGPRDVVGAALWAGSHDGCTAVRVTS